MQGKQKRAYLYRFYPTDEQARILARTFGCVRFAYNWALRLRTDAYVQEQKRVSYYDTSSQLARLKQQDDRAWLKEVSSVPLQQALRHLERAFRNFFEGRAACPKFKKADKRRDFQHKLSTRIIREIQVICVESLSVKNMLKNHCLAKHISDVGWGEFVRQLEYKSAWYGRTLAKIDRWYPSSKTCSSCRHVLETLSLDERFWTCPSCGTVHDRDINASKNILAEGLSVHACGGRVRPVRVRTRQASPIETGSSSS